MGLITSFVRFYDTPRSKTVCFLGAIIVMPLLNALRRDLKKQEEDLNRRTILLGRLELTATLLSKWWVEPPKKRVKRWRW